MQSVREIHQATEADLTPELLSSVTPVVLRGLVAHWPLVQAAQQSDSATAAYLQPFITPKPVQAFLSPPPQRGLYSYNADLTEFNFQRKLMPLAGVLEHISQNADVAEPHGIYVGSTSVNHILPGLRHSNDIAVLQDKPLVSIWLSNPSRIPAHYDVTDNIACVAAGRRRFTLFAPDQLDNLYVGPLDFTPAGQPVSLVDIQQPDFARFPKYRQALQQAQVAELAPGDAIFIPAMWWHSVAALGRLNILINYWWRQVDAFYGAPGDALQHALLSIRDLPVAQRQVWRELFDYYVFAPQPQGHIPPQAQGVLQQLDELQARKLRALLLNKLNR